MYVLMFIWFVLCRLQSDLEDLQRLWVQCQRGIRCKIIASTVKLIKSWPSQINSEGSTGIAAEPMEAIIRATQQDADKLLLEYGAGSTDPAYYQLQDELRSCDEVASLLRLMLSHAERGD